MRTISFMFGSEVSPARARQTLQDISRFAGVSKAKLLNPHATNSTLRQMAYAIVSEEASLEDLQKQLSAKPEIVTESVDVPAERALIW